MEIFINERSLHGQYYEKIEFEKSLMILESIFYFINETVKSENKRIFGDISVFVDYEAIRGSNFFSAFKNSNPQIRQNFRDSVFIKSGAKNWTSEQVHSHEDKFLYLSPDEDIHDISNTSIAEVTERTLQNPNNNYLLVNFINSIFCVENFQHPDIHECFSIPIVKNDTEEFLIKLDSLDNKSAIENWLREKQILKDPDLEDCLKDTTRFEKTSIICQGRSVYREISTQYFWYLDNLHKSHFEIFDPTGKHHIRLGDLEGNSRESTKKERKGKKPII
ncbi:MAG: hypothetical protein M1G31_20150 [Pseudanabaena sp. Salubria-1]|nr:hypothetical protein [Pseudanabaena sp. Salubria-1]